MSLLNYGVNVMSLHVEAPFGGETLLKERNITLLEQMNTKKHTKDFNVLYRKYSIVFRHPVDRVSPSMFRCTSTLSWEWNEVPKCRLAN